MLTAISLFFSFFFFNDTATTEIYTLPLHAALPISARRRGLAGRRDRLPEDDRRARPVRGRAGLRRSGGPGHAAHRGEAMSDDVTHRVSAEGVDPLALAGVNDGNLIELAKLLGVRVSLRGDTL